MIEPEKKRIQSVQLPIIQPAQVRGTQGEGVLIAVEIGGILKLGLTQGDGSIAIFQIETTI